MKGISDEDYEHAQKVWNAIGGVALGNYHDVYLNTDVLLLPDVFETFRHTCQEHYGIDLPHFYTTPGLAWRAALKETKVALELLTDINMLLMFEKGLRGGIIQAVKRYAKANNSYMPDYKPDEASTFIQYLDANNFYGWAMVQKLPTNGFRWIKDPEKFTPEFIEKLVEKDNKGYILEVDVEYPQTLHKTHNDLPFLPETMTIGKVRKLVPNLYNKQRYVMHIRTWNQALKHGLVLTKVHRAIKFEQEAWLKPYIDKNTQLRTKAKIKSEQDFFKLMNNSVFCKTMENLRNHRDIKLITDEQQYKKYVQKLNFKDSVRFSENLIGVEIGKLKITMNKPVYLGQAIIDMSKLDIAGDVEARFDTSGYSKDDNRPLPLCKNKKVICLMKDELSGKIMTEFVALRAKMYAYRILDESEGKRCKGIKSFEDYKECLFGGKTMYREQVLFEHKKHEIYTVNKSKIALNRDDDKRIIAEDGIKTQFQIDKNGQLTKWCIKCLDGQKATQETRLRDALNYDTEGARERRIPQRRIATREAPLQKHTADVDRRQPKEGQSI
ncbi:uncharacterized protein LOC130645896 [Hydractinia symbiolongicarpus]|uniref:uncharacterized protein LOC130645896 n=1 Tax=Hydractinia symbiolongicarpus TaxID=13093 RepID=UPI00254B0654|nr:uncharacterized protein LOC130645896 [Hydractinia symbiolongicarpus]